MSSHSRGDNEGSWMGYMIKPKVELRNPWFSGFVDMGKWVVIQEGIMRVV